MTGDILLVYGGGWFRDLKYVGFQSLDEAVEYANALSEESHGRFVFYERLRVPYVEEVETKQVKRGRYKPTNQHFYQSKNEEEK